MDRSSDKASATGGGVVILCRGGVVQGHIESADIKVAVIDWDEIERGDEPALYAAEVLGDLAELPVDVVATMYADDIDLLFATAGRPQHYCRFCSALIFAGARIAGAAGSGENAAVCPACWDERLR